MHIHVVNANWILVIVLTHPVPHMDMLCFQMSWDVDSSEDIDEVNFNTCNFTPKTLSRRRALW